MSDIEFGENGAVNTPMSTDMPRPLINRYTPTKWAFYVFIGFSVITTLSVAFEIYYRMSNGADPYYNDSPAMIPFFIAAAIGGFGYVIAFIVSIVFTCMWTFRAMKNLHIVHASHVEMSPGWAVGWYFVPLASLFKPFEGFREIWRGTHEMAGMDMKVPNYVGWWWGLWIVSNIMSNISMRVGGISGESSGYTTGLWIDMVSAPMNIIAAFLLLKAMKRVSEVQLAMRKGGVADTFS